jgi:hypothetical protein
MCILPNFEASDLKELERKGKRGKKAQAEAVEIVMAEQALEKPV